MRPLSSSIVADAFYNKSILGLPRGFSSASNTNVKANKTQVAPDNAATCWSNVDNCGSYISASFQPENVWYEIVNITGGGFLTSIIGPVAHTVGNHEIEFKVTVDGVEEIITLLCSNASRAILGAIFEGTGATNYSDLDASNQFNVAAEPYGQRVHGTHHLPSPHFCIEHGLALVRFKESLNIQWRIVTSRNINTTYNCNSGAMYVTD